MLLTINESASLFFMELVSQCPSIEVEEIYKAFEKVSTKIMPLITNEINSGTPEDWILKTNSQ